jgi:lipopolysaccharide/colanic/teichoic acid biosynthesis glycosyltransferase
MRVHQAVGGAERARRVPQLSKRAFDIVVSLVALAVFSPVLALIALLIRLDSPGPAIFRQKRVGRNGEIFTCLKFRTMVSGAEEKIHQQAIQRLWAGERLSDDPNSAYKMSADPRVTRVGRWLRRRSADELPQLVNVLLGQMSIVGPRPIIPYELEFLQEWHHERHTVRPGITGLWQVRGRSRVGIEEMFALDVEYARTWSFLLDLQRIMLTIPAVLTGVGAR